MGACSKLWGAAHTWALVASCGVPCTHGRWFSQVPCPQTLVRVQPPPLLCSSRKHSHAASRRPCHGTHCPQGGLPASASPELCKGPCHPQRLSSGAMPGPGHRAGTWLPTLISSNCGKETLVLLLTSAPSERQVGREHLSSAPLLPRQAPAHYGLPNVPPPCLCASSLRLCLSRDSLSPSLHPALSSQIPIACPPGWWAISISAFCHDFFFFHTGSPRTLPLSS